MVSRMGMVRPRDLAPYGIEPFHFRRLLRPGQLSQVSRGVYRSVEREPTARRRLAQAAKGVPHGAACLLSALQFRGLTKHSPPEARLAIDPKARRLSIDGIPIQFVRFSGAALQDGVEEHPVEGVPARVTSCPKTVADLFKYRNKLGLNVARDALRNCLRQETKCFYLETV
jgi:predicted transcriptional regulator of viral defense system